MIRALKALVGPAALMFHGVGFDSPDPTPSRPRVAKCDMT